MTWFKNLKTVSKLMLAFCLVSLCMAFVGYKGISAASALNTSVGGLYNHMIGLGAVKQANVHVVKIGREVRTMLLANDAAKVEAQVRIIEKDMEDMEQQLTAMEGTLVTVDGKAQMAKIKETIPEYKRFVGEIITFAKENKSKEGADHLKNGISIANQLNSQIAQIVRTKEEVGKQAYDTSNATFNSLRTTLITIVCIASLLSLALGYFIAQLIAKPLAATVEVLDKVAAGDMTARMEVDTKDEVGQMAESLNRATESMHQALSEVRNSADSMASAAQELASASEELSSGAQEQASSLEETTATLEEITSTVKQNADNAKQANQVANGSRETAEKGGHVVSEAVLAMGEINQSSKSIAEIITTIDEIAFQTNLLALNAAVEAARAGEQGRGFAVVATEVRNLAQRSATSAKEIKRLIQDSVRKVENGSSLVNKSGETLHEIVNSVKRVTDIVAEIAAASREQATGIEQVNKAMIQMDQVTQTNSSQTEELSATAQSMAAHAQQLRALVEKFNLGKHGSRSLASANSHLDMPSIVAPAPKLKAKAAAAYAGASRVKPNGHDHDANAFQEF